ncbi:MAG: hypothetical protein ACLRMZ_21330 [Blautia marasmi]
MIMEMIRCGWKLRGCVMREFNGLIKYQMQQYFSTSKFVMPFAVLMILLYSIYSSKPVGVMDSLTVSCVFLFLVMVWVGVTACDMEDMVSEQILILRVQSAGKYYVSHAVFLFTWNDDKCRCGYLSGPYGSVESGTAF